jgi:hypothetical protein
MVYALPVEQAHLAAGRAKLLWEPPKTAFRSQVDDGGSVFGVAGFIAAPSVCVFLTVNLLWLIGFGSFLVLIFAVQAAVRGRSFNRTICS